MEIKKKLLLSGIVLTLCPLGIFMLMVFDFPLISDYVRQPVHFFLGVLTGLNLVLGISNLIMFKNRKQNTRGNA